MSNVSDDFIYYKDNDLQELLDLTELYPDSEEEEAFLENEDFDDNCSFEDDYDAVNNGFQPNLPLQDPLLQLLKSNYGDSIFYNTEEENEVILQCTDSDLTGLLIKNRIRNKQLQLMRQKFIQILQDCVHKWPYKNGPPHPNSHIILPKVDSWRLGIPYFKDSNFYRCPENSDETRKRNNKEGCTFDYHVGFRWTINDQMLLRCNVEKSYYKYKLNEVKYKMKNLKSNEEDTKDKSEELSQLDEELSKLTVDPPSQKTPPLYSDEGIDWSMIANFFKGLRTVHECKAMWNLYLHPDINKNFWSAAENKKIKILVKKYNRQNWNLIAKELNTNRSGYLVFLNYFSNLWCKFKNDRFETSEDEKLMSVIEKTRVGDFIPWRQVALCFKDRSKPQLYHRYKYYLSQHNIIKGTFSEAEDILILYLVGKYGRNFSKCSEYVPTRSSVQIRNRFEAYLDKMSVSYGTYTEAEDQRILDFVNLHGTKRWKTLADELKRGRSNVRQRYLTLCKRLKFPDCNIKDMPRRKMHTLTKQSVERYSKLREIVQKLNEYDGEVTLSVAKRFLQDREDELSFKRKHWRVPKKNSFNFIDRKLVDFFKGTCKIQREYKTYGEDSVKDSAVRVRKLLDLFAVSKDVLNHKIEDLHDYFTDRECEVLAILKSNISLVATPQVRFLLPPTLNTVLGLRGLIVKFQMHKSCTIKSNSTDSNSGDNFEKDKLVFFERFCALFKWPSIVSKFFPPHLDKVLDIEDDDEPPKKSKGRPRKFENPKIASMINARKSNTLNLNDVNPANTPIIAPVRQSYTKKLPENKSETHSRTYLTAKRKFGDAEKTSDTNLSTISLDVLEQLKRKNKILVLNKSDLELINKTAPGKITIISETHTGPLNTFRNVITERKNHTDNTT